MQDSENKEMKTVFIFKKSGSSMGTDISNLKLIRIKTEISTRLHRKPLEGFPH